MVVGTATIVSEHMRGDGSTSISDSRNFPRPFVPQAKGPVIVDDFKLPVAAAPQLPGLNDVPQDNAKKDIIVDDVNEHKNDVMRNSDVVPPAMDVQSEEDKEKNRKEAIVREGGDGVKVGGGDGAGLQNEHEAIKKDMEELKERIKAVEEENQELKVGVVSGCGLCLP